MIQSKDEIQHAPDTLMPDLEWDDETWYALPEAERLRRIDDWMARHREWVFAHMRRSRMEIEEAQRKRGLFGISTSV